MLLEPTLSVINAGMVGHLGTQQLGAASVGMMVCNLSTALFSFLLFLTTPEVAAAVVKGDHAEVSRINARGLWVAGFFGILVTSLLTFGGRFVLGLIAPAEPEVMRLAVEYVGVRAWGTLFGMVGFVATGAFRGHKDTRTPLFAAVGAACSSLGLTYLFIHGFQLGVKGSAMAVTIAQAVFTTVLFGLMLYKGMIRPQDLVRPPSLGSVLPMLQKGLFLCTRNVIAFSVVMYGSTMCVRAGATYQAAYEIVRQVWMLTIQSFECLSVSAQAICAGYLGAGNKAAAIGALGRLLELGLTVSMGAGVVVFALQHHVAAFFTSDPAVTAQVLGVLPLVCLLFPVDAAACIIDGSLLAAKQSNYMAAVQILGSLIQLGVLLALTSHNMVTTVTIWAVLKLMPLVRMMSGIVRNADPKHSAYLPDAPAAKVLATEPNGAHASVPALNGHHPAASSHEDIPGPQSPGTVSSTD